MGILGEKGVLPLPVIRLTSELYKTFFINDRKSNLRAPTWNVE